MPKPVDMELKKAFLLLQMKMVETNKKLQEIEAEINQHNFLKQHVDINLRALRNCPEGTPTYEAIGRMFRLRDNKALRRQFGERRDELTLIVVDLFKKRDDLEKDLKESEDNLREMVQLRKEADAKS